MEGALADRVGLLERRPADDGRRVSRGGDVAPEPLGLREPRDSALEAVERREPRPRDDALPGDVPVPETKGLQELDLLVVARGERGVPPLGRHRDEALRLAEQDRLAETRPRGDEGAVPVGVVLSPVQDLEVGGRELGEPPAVRLEVVQDDGGDAEVGADLRRVDREGDVRPLGPAVAHRPRDAERGGLEAPVAGEEALEGVVERREVARGEARASPLHELPALLLEESEPHVRSADVSGEQHVSPPPRPRGPERRASLHRGGRRKLRGGSAPPRGRGRAPPAWPGPRRRRPRCAPRSGAAA